MKKKIKKVFESAAWWSGVLMIGVILGFALQFAKAWTEPTDDPPGGNVGAPINTGPVQQIKTGLLTLGALATDHIFNSSSPTAQNGYVLTLADNSSGTVTWAQSVGNGGVYTALGTKTCAAGWTAAYTGRYYAYIPTGSISITAPFCSATPPSSSGFDGTRKDGGDCAQCVREGAYTALGTNTCPNGWTAAYTGRYYAYIPTGSSEVTDVFCSDTSPSSGFDSVGPIKNGGDCVQCVR